MTSLAEVIATLPPEHRGIIEAAELNLTTPCTVPWCDHQCRWAHDIVGGSVSRLHGRDLAAGNELAELEYPPGSTETSEGPHLYITQEFENAGLIPAQVVTVITELTEALQLMSPNPTPLATWSAPAWATSQQFDHACIYFEREVKRGDVTVVLSQTVQMEVAGDDLQLVRQPVVVSVHRGDADLELDVDEARRIVGMLGEDTTGALTEALAAYDGATLSN